MLQRHLAPPFVKTTSLNLPDPIVIPLKNDANIFIINGIKQQVCKIEFVFQSGKWYESKIGLSYFTPQLILKGTKTKSSTEIANIIDHYGAHLEVNPGYDFVSISLYTLKDHLSYLLPIVHDLFSEPSFPAKEWSLMKGIFIENLKVSNEKTSIIASKALRSNIYGANHPYGSSIEERDIENLHASDFAEFFFSQFKIKDIFICGDLDDSDLSFIKAEFNFICGVQTQNKIPFGTTLPFTQHIEKNSVQSSIRLGKRSLLKSDPNYFTALILNHLLGGFFGSRLMKNIREEKGLTYGIHSSIHGLKNDSFFIIEADVNKENLEIALSEIRKEIRNLSAEKGTSNELDLAKNHFIGSLQSELANPFAIIEKIKNIQLNTLPNEYYQNLVQHVNNLTTNDIQVAAQKLLKEETFFEVSVGS